MTIERFPAIPPEQMTPEQRRAAEGIVSGPRGGMRGPFNAWLRSPEVADRFQRVGEYVRFKTCLPFNLNELAILVTAREWTSQYEWFAHRRLALQAGLPEHIADAIAAGKRPAPMSDDEAMVYDFATELHRTKEVSDPTFDRVKARFGEQGVIDLVAVCGYYTAVAMTLNLSRVPLPEGAVPLPRL